MRLAVTLSSLLKMAIYTIKIAVGEEVKKRRVMRSALFNVIRYIWTNTTPKQAFIECYKRL